MTLIATPTMSASTFSIVCEAPGSERGQFMIQTSTDDRVSFMAFEGTGLTFPIFWYAVGDSTVIVSQDENQLVFAFENETLEGWLPYEPGFNSPANCKPGAFAITIGGTD